MHDIWIMCGFVRAFVFFGTLLISLMLAWGYYSSRVGALRCSAQCTRVLFCDWLLCCHVNTHLFKGPFPLCALVLSCDVSVLCVA